MIAIHDDLLTMIDAVLIESPHRYTLNGLAREFKADAAAVDSDYQRNSGVVVALASDLYRRLFLRANESPSSCHADLVSERDFVAALSAANAGAGTWEPGWTILRTQDDGQVVVTKNCTAFWTSPTDVRTREGQIAPGAGCRIRVSKELRHRLRGAYFAIGDQEETDPEVEDDGRQLQVQYHWHLRVAAAVSFVASATSILNASRTPFRLKVLTDPRAFHRADAGVIFVSRRHHTRVGAQIAEIYGAVSPGLRSNVPLLTKRLADGLGLSEGSSGSRSFGHARCQLVAHSLWHSFLEGEVDRDALAANVARTFLDAGLDPVRPYMEPGSHRDYDLPSLPPNMITGQITAIDACFTARTKVSEGRRSLTTLEAASRAGSVLCGAAHWDDEERLCNWMGRPEPEVWNARATNAPTSSALTAGLGSGTAGIALFLAELSCLTDDTQFRRTALGAINRSIHRIDRIPRHGKISPMSLLRGEFGVAFAAARVGALTGTDDLIAHASSIIERACGATSTLHSFDVIMARAGAIPALLSLARDLGLGHCREEAIALGEMLCLRAARGELLWFCGPAAVSRSDTGALPTLPVPGASGIGLALFELYDATGSVEFLEAGRAALAYEDSVSDTGQSSGADRRLASGRLTDERPWRHALPGRALARIRAANIDPDRADIHRAKGRIALDATLEALDEKLSNPEADASLGQGLAGLGEIILIAGQLLGDQCCLERARTIGRTLIDGHAASGDWLSSGASGGPNPSLMTGLAGIAYFWLRLYAPARIPSIRRFAS